MTDRDWLLVAVAVLIAGFVFRDRIAQLLGGPPPAGTYQKATGYKTTVGTERLTGMLLQAQVLGR